MKRRDATLDFFDRLLRADEASWRPSADVLRTRNGWIVKLDLAGVRPAELSVAIEGKFLRVSGVRRDLHAADSLDHQLMEIVYSGFERRFEIPCDLGECRIATDYHDGMLIVFLETRR